MKTPSLLMLCLATFPILARSQSVPIVSTNASPATGKSLIEKALPEVTEPARINVRTPDAPAQSDLSPSLGNRSAAPKLDASAEQQFSRLSFGKNDFAASGFLVDIFRSPPPPAEKSEKSEMTRTFLGIPVTNIVVAEPWPSGGWKRAYFKWGAREEPWSTVAERRSAGPESTLFSVHF